MSEMADGVAAGAAGRRRAAPAWIAAVPATLWIAHLLTYSPYADGPARAYVAAALLGALCAAVVALLVWLERPTALRLVVAAATLALLPQCSLHAVRRVAALTMPHEHRTIASFGPAADQWRPSPHEWTVEFAGSRDATLSEAVRPRRHDGGLRLSALGDGAGVAAGWIEWQLPLAGDAAGPAWLPRGYSVHVTEAVCCTAAAAVTRERMVVADVGFSGGWGSVLIEIERDGAYVIYDGREGVSRTRIGGTEIASGVRRWHVVVSGGWAGVGIDGVERWSRAGAHRLRYVRFGDTRPEASHGGTVLLRDAVYARRHLPGSAATC